MKSFKYRIVFLMLLLPLYNVLIFGQVKQAISDTSKKVEAKTNTAIQKSSGCSYPLSSDWITINKSRGKINLYYQCSPMPKVTFNVDLDYQWKQTIGGWGHSKFGPLTVNGTWTLNIFRENSHDLSTFTDTYTRSYSKTYPSANHLQLSINPKTGLVAPTGTQFTYSVPNGWVIQRIYLTNVHWHGSVPGGAHGIDCYINCP